MTTRADLIEAAALARAELDEWPKEWPEGSESRQFYLYRGAVIIDRLLPQITTAEQLEALPSRSMLVDCDGEPAVKVKRLTVIDDAGMGNAWTVEEFAEDCLPATVVWQPQPEQETRP